MVDIINLWKITSLALVNSVNPCQIAMLVLVLITILTQNKENRKKILFSGFAFIFAVYIGYLFYGIVLVQLFATFTELLRQSSFYIKYVFAVIAMLVGGLQIKDFFFYKPGSFATEMPIWMRARAKRVIEKITSPVGAFLAGFVITLFLGPCTMAPLLVATETLSALGFFGALPWLLYFNLIAVLPLIAITLIVYKGFTTAERVSEWRNRNIKLLHLIAGILFFAVGLALLMGWL
ncbi:MAG: sulfite exporter TauE/SafE family protein [Candidatus Pacearchaeota archaeon]|nr:sulfite exporter TauE/SafE family protein [Candidatus Pacearchaeota archaeon]